MAVFTLGTFHDLYGSLSQCHFSLRSQKSIDLGWVNFALHYTVNPSSMQKN